MALKPTLYRNTTWPITCECACLRLFSLSLSHQCPLLSTPEKKRDMASFSLYDELRLWEKDPQLVFPSSPRGGSHKKRTCSPLCEYLLEHEMEKWKRSGMHTQPLREHWPCFPFPVGRFQLLPRDLWISIFLFWGPTDLLRHHYLFRHYILTWLKVVFFLIHRNLAIVYDQPKLQFSLTAVKLRDITLSF